MLQIAIKIENGVVDGYADENTALEQAKVNGWTLVNSDPAFLISQMSLWTIREPDHVLVHVSTGMTPDEEQIQASSLLGKNVAAIGITASDASAKAKSADEKADNAIAGLAMLGKQVAASLATQTTDNGGSK